MTRRQFSLNLGVFQLASEGTDMSGADGRKTMFSWALFGAVALGALTAATAASAQTPVSTAPAAAAQAPQSGPEPSAPAPTPPASAPSSQATQEVVVTGSLFRRPNFDTPSPVTQLTATDIAQEGITNISDAIRSVAADNSGTIPNAFSNGFAAGASGVALRGLTAADTLVLIDGLRTASYPVADDGVRSFTDLNTIPISTVDQVQVLKDGASAIYGSDAVAGVVNIIMKKQFQGFEGDASYGDSQHGGGSAFHAYGLFGAGDLGAQGWNAYVDVEYQQDSNITAGQRDFPYNTTDLTSIGGNNLNLGEPGVGTQQGSIYGSVTPGMLGAATPGYSPLLNGIPNTGATSQILRAGGCGVRGTATTDAGGNVYCSQNFVPYYDDQPADQRWGVYGHFTKNLGQSNQFFANVYYYENKINVYGAPSQIQNPAPINTDGIALPPTLSNGALNPNNPFAATGQYALINYAFGDIPFNSTYDDHVIRGSAGFTGDLEGFHYSASVTIAHNSLDTSLNGYINYNQLINDINTGAYSFVNPATNTASVLSALSPTLAKTSVSDLDTLDITITRDVFNLPGGPLQVGVGGQLRYERIDDPGLNTFNADGTPNASSVLALGVAETAGHRYVGAAFFDVLAPVTKQIEVDVAGRYDHYSDFGGTFNPQVGLKYRPFRWVTFRGTYGQGFRAPSFSQNGSSASEGFINYTPPPGFQQLHNNDAYVQQYSLAEFSVANPAIQPETSETFTAGVIFQPDRRVNLSLDYYHIRQNGIIAQSDPSAVLNAYYNGTALPQGASISLDQPDPNAPNAARRVTVVESPFVNANALTTDGLDIDLLATYELPFQVHYTSNLNATDIFGYEYTASGSTTNYVGTQSPYILSSGAGTPKYRATWLNSFAWQKLTVSGTLNFVSGIKETGVDATGDPSVTTGCLYTDANSDPFPRSCHVKSFWDIDMTTSYQLTPNIQFYFNVLNLTDKSAPLDPADYAGSGANYNPTYDQAGIVGRYFRGGIHVKFK